MKNIEGFKIEISSDLDYKYLIVNVLYKEEPVAIISQEKGPKNLEIEILPAFDNHQWKFVFEDFVSVLQYAKKCLVDDS